MKNINAFGTHAAEKPLEPMTILRREPGAKDVEIEIQYCGICHSDLHTARNEWHGTVYPCVPGHEIVGKVTRIGDAVKKFKVGDLAGVGCMVDSCGECEYCQESLEQYCEHGSTGTYNSPDDHLGGMTYGGYSQSIVVDENFVLKIPSNLDLASTAPLLCAGITTYSPLRHWKVKAGDKVGVVGLGGLGHMGVKLAKAMGAHVTVFTTSPSKMEDAKRLGADEVILSKDKDAMKAQRNKYDFILNTVSADHDINVYLAMLKPERHLALVGAPENPIPVEAFSVIMGRRSFAGSNIGGIKETQEMLDFCGEHNITSDIEIIPAEKINEAYERMVKGDVKYRFVIDIASLKEAE